MKKWKVLHIAYWAAACVLPLPLSKLHDYVSMIRTYYFNGVPFYVYAMCLYIGIGVYLGFHRILSLAMGAGRWKLRWGHLALSLALLAIGFDLSFGYEILFHLEFGLFGSFMYEMWFLYAILSGFCLTLLFDKTPLAETKPIVGAEPASGGEA